MKKSKNIKRKVVELTKRIVAGVVATAICFPSVPAGETLAGELDFSCCELLIAAPSPEFFLEDTEIVSSYNGIYLTRFSDAYETQQAYEYYSELASLVEVNGSVQANDEGAVWDDSVWDMEGSPTDAAPEEEALEYYQEPYECEDAFSYIDELPVSDYSGCIALIDTGASGSSVVGAISVIGESAADDNGHGTLLSNAIAEVNPEARILSIKALDSNSQGSVSDVYAAIQYAIKANVSVINLSLCSVASASSDLMRSAVNEAVSRGIIVVVSAGNKSSDASYYTPANIGAAYTIGSADSIGNRNASSNYGELVDYYVTADSTSVAAAKFSAYVLNGIDSLSNRSDVFTREFVESEKNSHGMIFEPEIKIDEGEESADEETQGEVVEIEPFTNAIFSSEDGPTTEEEISEPEEKEDTSIYSLPSVRDEEGGTLPNTNIMGVFTPSSNEIAEEILLRGALTESSSWAECLNTIYGFGVIQQDVDSRPTGYPRWINATGMTINNGTSTGISSNYTGAIASFGTLTAYGGDSLDNFELYGSDDPSVVHTACYDHHIGINKSVPPLGVQSIASINFEYAGYDGSGWYYYCAIIRDWENSGHQRIFAYLCIKKNEAEIPEETWYYYGFGVKKVDPVDDKPLGGVTFDIYNSDWGLKIGSVTTNESDGIGVFRWSDVNYYGRDFVVMLIETDAPEGYKSNIGKRYGPYGVKGASVEPSPCTSKMFEINEVGIEAEVPNEHDLYYSAVGVHKYDSISNADISGVIFDIYASPSLSSTKLGEITTDSTGKGSLSWSSTEQYSSAYAYERYAPYPYNGNIGKWYELTVTSGSGPIASTGIRYKDVGNDTSYSLKLIKKSANEDVTESNPNYDLDGTTYEIYRRNNDSYVGSIEIDSDGKTKTPLDITKWMIPKTGGGYTDTEFYYKETKVGRNYSLDNLGKVGYFTVLSSNRESTVEVTDIPEINTVNLTINKKDITGAEADLSDVEFTLNYYMLDASDDTEYSLEDISEVEPTRSWVIKTDEKNIANLDDSHKVSGDDYYIDIDTEVPGIPLGWLTIQETKAPEGYLINNEVSLIKIDSTSAAENKLNVISSTIMNENGTGELFDIPVRADIAFEKTDYETGKPMSGVEFEITNTTTGESHVVKTGEDGTYDSSIIQHSSEDGLWFSKNSDGSEGEVTDSLGALTLGDYEVKELSCDANQGYQLEEVKYFSVTTEDNEKIFKIYDNNASSSAGKIHNVKNPRLSTTANVIETESHTAITNGAVTIEDKVEYWYLESGETYTLLGRLMIKEADGTFHPYKKIIKGSDGTYQETEEELTSMVTFKTGAEYSKSLFEQCGTKTVTFENVIAPEKDAGKSYVVFEYLYKGEYDANTISEAGEPYIKHEEDIYEQTVYVPKLSTTATDKADGDKEVESESDVTVVDKVVCEGLTKDHEYTMKGWLVYKTSGDKVLIDGKPIETEKKFTATGEKTEVELEFSFNTKGLDDTELVVFEECQNEIGILIGWHKDLTDSGQTFKVKPETKTASEIPEEITTEENTTEETTPTTETPSVEKNGVINTTIAPKTGDGIAIRLIVSILLISGVGIIYILYKKRKMILPHIATKNKAD